jgi:hypothetical protein
MIYINSRYLSKNYLGYLKIWMHQHYVYVSCTGLLN